MADAAITKIDIVIKTESKFRTGEVKEDALRWNYVHKIIEWWTGEEWKSVYVESQGQGVTGSITFKLADGKTYQFTGSEVIDLSNGVYYAANCKNAEHATDADEAVHALNADNADFANRAEKAKRDEQGAIIHETYATIAWVNEIVNGTNEQLPASGMSWEVDANYENGATITLPSSLKYAFGMHSLRLALDGAILSQGISYNEVDMGVATSSKINLMCALEKGMILDIWIIPVGINSGMLVLADAVQAKLNQYRDEADTIHLEVVESRNVIRNEVNSAKSTLQSYVDQASDLLSDAGAITAECEAFRTEYLEYLKTCEVFMDSSEASAYAARAAADEAITNVVMSRELLESTAKQADSATEQAQIATNHANYITSVIEDAESHLAEAKNASLTEIQTQEDTSIQSISDYRDAVINELGNIIYPVGSIYMSMNETNPSTFFGGTWERLADGRCLIGGGGNSGYAIGATGGEVAHTLTAGEMPSHNHGATTANGGHSHDRGSMEIWGAFGATIPDYHSDTAKGAFAGTDIKDAGRAQYNSASPTPGAPIYGYDFYASRHWIGATNTVANHQHDTQNAGAGQSHNNMQPYLAVAIWKRIA
jgi:microcystin-dependent protein